MVNVATTLTLHRVYTGPGVPLLLCYKPRASDAFTFEFAILSCFTRKDNCLYCLHLYIFHFLRLKQKMDSLLFLIKKHNNNKTVRYNDKLAYKTFINKNE